jgi:hypothetical protein
MRQQKRWWYEAFTKRSAWLNTGSGAISSPPIQRRTCTRGTRRTRLKLASPPHRLAALRITKLWSTKDLAIDRG